MFRIVSLPFQFSWSQFLHFPNQAHAGDCAMSKALLSIHWPEAGDLNLNSECCFLNQSEKIDCGFICSAIFLVCAGVPQHCRQSVIGVRAREPPRQGWANPVHAVKALPTSQGIDGASACIHRQWVQPVIQSWSRVLPSWASSVPALLFC